MGMQKEKRTGGKTRLHVKTPKRDYGRRRQRTGTKKDNDANSNVSIGFTPSNFYNGSQLGRSP